MGVPVGMSVGSSCSTVRPIGTQVGVEYMLAYQLEIPVVTRDQLACQLVWDYLLACQLEVSVVFRDLLTRKLVWEYLLAYQFEVPVIPV